MESEIRVSGVGARSAAYASMANNIAKYFFKDYIFNKIMTKLLIFC